MIRYSFSALLVLWFFASGVQAQAQTLAFPGAEGLGRFAKGGRGGVVLHVTNLNASGPGSLLAAIQDARARTVVFDVSGTIQWGRVRIDNPYITIAGETAPEHGILIRGGLDINTHDVIVRHMRFRPGYTSSGNPNTAYSPGSTASQFSLLLGGTDNIIDHCSFTWCQDDTMTPWQSADVTVQRSIIANALFYPDDLFVQKFGSLNGSFGRGKGGIVWGRASLLHNLWANLDYRSPNIKGGDKTTDNGDIQIVNCLMYNVGGRTTNIYPWNNPVWIEFINNYFDWNSGMTYTTHEIVSDYERQNTKIFLEGNHDVDDPNVNKGTTKYTSISVRHPEYFPEVPSLHDPYDVKDDLLGVGNAPGNVGAMLPVRSAIDQAIIDDVKNNHQNTAASSWDKNSVTYPDIPFVKRPTGYDTDRDGIPNDWELAHGLDPNDGFDGAVITADGYSNLEHYLHDLNGKEIADSFGREPGAPGHLRVHQN
jgi:hypothetical protein